MLVALSLQAATGLFSDDEIATQGPLAVKVSDAVVSRMSAFHHYNQWTVVVLVALHLVAIAVYRFVWRVRLVPPMVHGRMEVGDAAAVPRLRHPALGAVLFALACAAVYYLVVIFPRSPA
jgi:cytochrome b